LSNKLGRLTFDRITFVQALYASKLAFLMDPLQYIIFHLPSQSLHPNSPSSTPSPSGSTYSVTRRKKWHDRLQSNFWCIQDCRVLLGVRH